MMLRFTKGSGKLDTMEVVREGTPTERIDCPKQRIIPHDMMHYAVEHTLQVRGFLGRVRDGEAAGFGMVSQADSDAVERLVEVFQGDEWSGGQSEAADLIAMYKVTCAARNCPMLPVSMAEILAIRATISELTRRWQAIAPGESLLLTL
mgnify:CR=1 FL=1